MLEPHFCGGNRDEPAEISMLRESVRQFAKREILPNAAQWRRDGMVPRTCWSKAGASGFLGLAIPEAYGGSGLDFRYEAALIEELAYANFPDFAIALHGSIVAPYVVDFGSEAQKRRWLPRLATGDLVAAIAMTEPGTGSDLRGIATTARRDGEDYVISGQKTFISNGQLADFIVVAARTGERGAISLLAVEAADLPGFRRGRMLEKIGLHAQDTSELFFDEVRVPTTNLLGDRPGQGMAQLKHHLARERLVIAVQAAAAIELAVAITLDYVKERVAFGKRLIDFQNTRFVLAEARTDAVLARRFIESCITRLVRDELAPDEAAMAKWWITERQCRVVDQCLQLHGGYGYVLDYPIAQMFADARIQTIYGGSNEIMKEIIAKSFQ